jgi:diguanylate cyclase (GGDEF)-like protein
MPTLAVTAKWSRADSKGGTIAQVDFSDKTGTEAATSRLSNAPLPLRLMIYGSVAAAIVLPFLLASRGQGQGAHPQVVTGSVLLLLSILNIEIGRVIEGGVRHSQRPHKALSAWSFAAALVLPTPWLLPVAALSYTHARWRGIRVPLWKWVGSSAYVIVAGVCAALTARALHGTDPNWMNDDGGRGLFAVVAAAGVFLAVQSVLFHGSAYLNHAEDERWLRRTLRTPSFYLTEGGVLLVGGLSAALWAGGAWFLILLLPIYGLAQRAALHEPLRELAELDDKTGLLRYESWRRLAMQSSQRCAAKKQTWSVVLADLDHFKVINDSYGHLAGDAALIEVAGTLRSQLRSCDLLGRFGGEEFCIFLPGGTPEAAAHVAERLRAAIAALTVPETGHPLSISLGVATVPNGVGAPSFVDVLTEADRAVYDAKLGGRDRVRVRLIVQDQGARSEAPPNPTPTARALARFSAATRD